MDVLPEELLVQSLHFLGAVDLSRARGTCWDLWRHVSRHAHRCQLAALCVCGNKGGASGAHQQRQHRPPIGLVCREGMLSTAHHRSNGLRVAKWAHRHNDVCQVGG